jgi:hypothetical protein
MYEAIGAIVAGVAYMGTSIAFAVDGNYLASSAFLMWGIGNFCLAMWVWQ